MRAFKSRVGVLTLLALITGLCAVAPPHEYVAAEAPPVPEAISSLLMVGPNGNRYEWSSADGDEVVGTAYPHFSVHHWEPGQGQYGVEIAPLWLERLHVGRYDEASSVTYRDGDPPSESLALTFGSTVVDGRGSFTIHALPENPDTTTGLWFTWELKTRAGQWFGEARVGVRQTQPELVSAPGIIEWAGGYPGLPAPRMPVTFTARGDEPVRVEDVRVTAGQSEFSVLSSDCALVQPGESCQVVVAFTPTSAGPRTGLLSIRDSTPQGIHQVPLLGRGIPGETSWSLDNPPSTGFSGGGRDTLTPDRYEFTGFGSATRLDFAFEIKDPAARAHFYTGDIRIVAPADQTFVAGETYAGLTRFGQAGAGSQDVTLDSIGCNSSSGTLTVHDIAYSPRGHVTSADVEFTQQCGDRNSPLTGRVLWRANQQPVPPPPGDTEAPATLSDLRVVSTPEHPLELRWADSSSTDWVEVIVRGRAGTDAPTSPTEGYPVYRGRFPFAYVDDLAMVGTHSFAAFPRDAAGNVGQSATLTVEDVVPPQRLDVEVDAARPDVTLTWTPPAAADWDRVLVTASRWPGATDERSFEVPGRPEHAVLTGLDTDSHWQVWVRPIDAAGNVGSADPTVLSRTRNADITASPTTITCGEYSFIEGSFFDELETHPDMNSWTDLEQRVDGGSWTFVERRPTLYGAYIYAPKPCRTTEYRVRFDGHREHLWATSPPVSVSVKPVVALSASRSRIAGGDRVTFTTSINPADVPTPTRLQARTASGWETLRSATHADGEATFTILPRRSADYRVLVPGSTAWLRATSDAVRVRVR